MVIKMILRQIREDADLEINALEAALREPVRTRFEAGVKSLLFMSLLQHALQHHGIGRCHTRVALMPRDLHAERADVHRGFM